MKLQWYLISPLSTCVLALFCGVAAAGPAAMFTGKIVATVPLEGNGAFTGSSAYVQLWVDRDGDGLSLPVPGMSTVDDDILIREVPILNEKGLFGTDLIGASDGLVPGVYWVRAIASVNGSCSLSTVNGTNGEDCARTSGDPGFGSAPGSTALYGDARITMDGENVVSHVDLTSEAFSSLPTVSFYTFVADGTCRAGTIEVRTPYPSRRTR